MADLTVQGSIIGNLQTTGSVTGSLQTAGAVTGNLSTPQSRIVYGDYEDLTGKPKINGVTVEGDKSGEDYRLQDKQEIATNSDIDDLIYGG